MTRRLTAGTRASRLAMIQTGSVLARLKEAFPSSEVTISQVTTTGDRDRRTPLHRMPGIGVFVKELEEALLDERIDFAVHSLKDVPTVMPDGLALVAVTERLDPRDALVAGAPLEDLPAGARIGTGSLRRTVQIKEIRPDLEVVSIRGNVDTRLRKVADGEVDGAVLAAAALARLDCTGRIVEYLPVEHFLPSPGQGALAIESRTDDGEANQLLAALNDPAAWRCVTAERTFLNDLGGGCSVPIAALGTISGEVLELKGMVADPSGGKVLRAEIRGSTASPEEVGAALAQRMAEMGARELLSEVTGT